MLDKKLTGTHINKAVYASVKGEFEVTGVLSGFEYLSRELPREPRHPLMGSTLVQGVELHIGNKVYFMREDALDKVIIFL